MFSFGPEFLKKINVESSSSSIFAISVFLCLPVRENGSIVGGRKNY